MGLLPLPETRRRRPARRPAPEARGSLGREKRGDKRSVWHLRGRGAGGGTRGVRSFGQQALGIAGFVLFRASLLRKRSRGIGLGREGRGRGEVSTGGDGEEGAEPGGR